MARPELSTLLGNPDAARGLLTDFALDLTETYHPDSGLPTAERGLEWSVRMQANRLCLLSWRSQVDLEVDGRVRAELVNAAIAAAQEGSHWAPADTAIGRTMSVVGLRIWPPGLAADTEIRREARLQLNSCAPMDNAAPQWAKLLQALRDALTGRLAPDDDACLERLAALAMCARVPMARS